MKPTIFSDLPIGRKITLLLALPFSVIIVAVLILIAGEYRQLDQAQHARKIISYLPLLDAIAHNLDIVCNTLQFAAHHSAPQHSNLMVKVACCVLT